MIVLALDLGTTTGWAIGANEATQSGTWSLKPGRHDGGGMRFVRFRKSLNEIKEAWPNMDAVFYEEVRRHAGTDAAHVYGGLLATLTEWCEVNKLPYSGLPVGEIKKHFTGSGNASKDRMIAECVDRGYQPRDDNEADAIAVHALGALRMR